MRANTRAKILTEREHGRIICASYIIDPDVRQRRDGTSTVPDHGPELFKLGHYPPSLLNGRDEVGKI